MTPKELAKADLNYILENARPAFEKLRHVTILLTGATGFFGTWFLESLLFANKELGLDLKLVVLLRNPGKWDHVAKDNACVEVLEGDVTHFSLSGRKLNYILHLASPEQNLIAAAMKNILETARHQEKCFVLFSSSGAIYGPQESGPSHLLEEDCPRTLDTGKHRAYAEGKREAESLALHYYQEYGVETKIARCFCFSGPLLPHNSGFAFGNFIRDGLNHNTINVQGDGSTIRSYMDADDLVVWLMQILIFGKPVRPYNVGSEEPLSIAELAKKIGDACGVPVNIQSPRQEGAPPACYIPSTKRAREELGLHFGVTVDESIRKTLDWYSH